MNKSFEEYDRSANDSRVEGLILDHLWLVRHIVLRMKLRSSSSWDLENLEAAGVLGLVEAAKRFEPSRNVDFSYYASVRVRGAVVDEIRRNIPIPQGRMSQIRRVLDAQRNSPVPIDLEAIAIQTEMTVDEVIDCLNDAALLRVKPLDPTGDTARAFEDSTGTELESEERTKLVTQAIVALPERERLVVTLYHRENLRLKEIGHVLKLSESRVSRILSSAQTRIRHFVKSREA